ncbi:hypothetical protein C8Q74DRAFT_126746 [Fomes fomentarius]|nr:hypothetical protein C8Q74DRAFT_126746 [Fomes fomentarius]
MSMNPSLSTMPGATPMSRSNASTPMIENALMRVVNVQGWSEHPPVCSVPFCVNALEAGKPWKQCRQCRERSNAPASTPHKQKVDVPCSCCFLFPVSVSPALAASGRRFLCRGCHERGKALVRANVQAPVAQIGLHQDRSREPSNPQSLPDTQPAALSAIAPKSLSILEQARRFVHPDHHHLLEPRDVPVSVVPIVPVSSAIILAIDEARRQPLYGLPHYGPRGEILAMTPEEVYGLPVVPVPVPLVPRASIPPSLAAPPPPRPTASTPIDIIEVPIRRHGTSRQVASPQTAPQVLAAPKPRTSANPSQEPTSEKSDKPGDQVPERVPRKKGKRTHPAPQHICATPDCGRTIPSQFQGTLCVQCGFSRWTRQFRTRFETLRAELLQASDTGAPETTDFPPGTVPPKVDSVVGNHEVKVERAKWPSIAPETLAIAPVEPDPNPTTTTAVAEAELNSLSDPLHKVVTMDVDSDSSDEEPLSARVFRLISSDDVRVTMPQAGISSDDEPLATKITSTSSSPEAPLHTQFVDSASYNDEPLSRRFHDSISSDEEPLAQARISFSAPRKLTEVKHENGGQSKVIISSMRPLKLVIPPALKPVKPPALRIRRVRLILGSRPRNIESDSSNSSSRDSSPERLSNHPSERGRSNSAINERWMSAGWSTDESELTPLEGSTDEGESELDAPESDDQARPPPPPVDSTHTEIAAPSTAAVKGPALAEKHRGQCTTSDCVNLLPLFWTWRHCDMCRLRTRISRQKKKAQEDGQEYEDIPLPSDGDLTGYRSCSQKRCNRFIPPVEQYKYRRCPRCRNWARKRMQKLRAARNNPLMAVFDVPGTSNTANTVEGQPSDVSPVQQGVEDSGDTLVDLPQFQHFAALSSVFHARFVEFVAAQARYVQLQAIRGAERKPMVFSFDGEYSIVADPSGGSIDAIVNTVIRRVTIDLGLVFTLAGVQSGPEDSVIAVLQCTYASKVPALKAKKEGDSEGGSNPPKLSAAVTEVSMVGELRICIAWDRRHKFFAGQRIMVRFRLVG